MGKLHQISDSSSNRIALSQRAHGRPLKEDSLNMPQLFEVRREKVKSLKLNMNLAVSQGKEVLKERSTVQNSVSSSVITCFPKEDRRLIVKINPLIASRQR